MVEYEIRSDIELDIDIFYRFNLDKTKIYIKHEFRSILFDLSFKLYHPLIYLSINYVYSFHNSRFSIQNLSFQSDKRYFTRVPPILEGTGRYAQELADLSVGEILFTVQVWSTIL